MEDTLSELCPSSEEKWKEFYLSEIETFKGTMLTKVYDLLVRLDEKLVNGTISVISSNSSNLMGSITSLLSNSTTLYRETLTNVTDNLAAKLERVATAPVTAFRISERRLQEAVLNLSMHMEVLITIYSVLIYYFIYKFMVIRLFNYFYVNC